MVQEGQSSFCVLFFLKFIHFWLKDNCLTVLCWFLPNLNANQPWIYICALPLETPSHLPPHPTPLGCYRALVWVTESYTNSHWLSVFAYGNVYFQVTLSPLLLIRCLECSVEKDSEATFCFRGSEMCGWWMPTVVLKSWCDMPVLRTWHTLSMVQTLFPDPSHCSDFCLRVSRIFIHSLLWLCNLK